MIELYTAPTPNGHKASIVDRGNDNLSSFEPDSIME